MSEQNLISYQIRGILSGFAALYALFVVMCLAILVLVLFFLSGTWLGDFLVIFALFVFVSLIIYACILQHKNPQAFVTKQEIKIVLEQYQAKEPKKHPKIIVSKPIPEKLKEIKGLEL